MLDIEITRCVNEEKPITLVFLDIDHFKRVNDSHGHLAGSRAISEFGHIIKETLRTGDFGARYGGDEFVMILPETSKTEAFKFTQDLRGRIKKNIFLTDMGLEIKLTASFGLATFPDDADSKDGIIKVADDLMYEVKKASRDGIAAV
jgi:diguanylate cyclase (GGDEF)-like protein